MFRSWPDQLEYNRVGPSGGHKIYFFQVQSGSGQDITGHYGVGVPKTFPRRTLILGMQILSFPCVGVCFVFCFMHVFLSGLLPLRASVMQNEGEK